MIHLFLITCIGVKSDNIHKVLRVVFGNIVSPLYPLALITVIINLITDNILCVAFRIFNSIIYLKNFNFEIHFGTLSLMGNSNLHFLMLFTCVYWSH